MAARRKRFELDPDYEDVTEQQNKRQRIFEEDAKEATVKRIKNIITEQFSLECQNKEKEINTIDQLIYQTKAQLDRLRACLVANYYGVSTQQKFPQEKAGVLQCPSIHPAVKQYLGKTPRFQPDSSVSASVTEQKECSSASSHNKDEGLARISGGVNVEQPLNEKNNNKTKELQSIDEDRRGSRFKIKKEIIVGNISKFIPLDKREENDQATHKWMVYVRGPKDKPRIDHFVKKIWFFMHPSYRPNDLVEISHAPFHLTRRGWGEFPIRVQLHFKDSRNKRVDIIHQLKLDRTYTGLQSLGAETVVEIEVERDSLMENDSVSNSTTAISSDHQCSKSSVVCEKMLIPSESLSLCKSKTISTGENDQTLDFISGKEDMFLSADNKNRHETSDMHLSNVKEALSENKGLAPKNTMHLKDISLTNRNYQQSTDSTLTNSSQENKSRTITISENDYLEINVNGNKLNDQDENLKDEKNVSFQSVQKPGWMEPTSVMRNISEDNKTLYSDLLGSNNMIAKENTGKSQIASPQKATTMSNVNKTTGPLSCFVVASKSDSAQTLSSSCLTTSHIFVQSSSSISSSGSLAANSLQTNTHPSLLGSTRVSAVEKSGQPSSQKSQRLHWLPHNTYIKCRDREGKLYLVHPDMLSYKPAKTTSGMCALAEMSLKIANVKITANRSLLSAKGQDNTLVPLTPPNILQTAVAPNTEKNIAIGRCCKPAHQITTNNGKIESPVLKSPVADNKAPYKVTSHGLVALSSSHNNTGLPTVVINNTSSAHAGGTNSRPPFVIKTVNSRNLVSLLSNKLTRTGANLACLKVKQSTANTSSATSGNSGTVSSPTVSGTLVLSSNQISVVPSANAHRTNQELNKGAVLSSEDSASLKTPPKTSEDLVAFKTANSGELVNSVTTAKQMIGLTVGSQKIVFQPLANQMHNIGQQRKTPVTKHCLGVGSVTQPIASSQLFSGSVKNPAVFGLKLEIKEKEKKIHVYKSKTKEVPSPVPTIEPLRLEFYPDMVSLLKASVKRHQLVSNDANHSLHPYRACCTEEWLQWNVGKRRASEWQRASSVRTFIQQQLGGTDVFKGEKVWTTKQIFTWCRLHTYSPHFLESAGRVQAEEPETSPVQMNSYSEASLVQNQVNKIGSSLPVISDSDEEIDILSLDVPKVRLKKDPEEYTEEKLLLSPTDEVIYVQETAQLIGIKFWPTEIIEGIYSHTAEMLIFTTMMDFMGDIIRLTFALKARKGRYPAELRMEDFHKALCSIPCADFLTNKYLGVLEDSVEKNLRLGEDGRTLGKAGVL